MFQSIYMSKVTHKKHLHNIRIMILIARKEKFASPFKMTKVIFSDLQFCITLYSNCLTKLRFMQKLLGLILYFYIFEKKVYTK